jgi:hypothetical protein
MIRDHYDTLGVSPRATAQEILKARNRLLLMHHPDRNPDTEQESKEKTIRIILASEVLLDQRQRAEYDAIYVNVYGGETLTHSPYVREYERVDIIICNACSRPNADTGRGYCIFCGSGIGDSPAPFTGSNIADFKASYMTGAFAFSALDSGCLAWGVGGGAFILGGGAAMFALGRVADTLYSDNSDAYFAFAWVSLIVFMVLAFVAGWLVTHKMGE